MKNILVPTDFSTSAAAAALYAAGLASQTSARVILLHAYHPAALLEEEEDWLNATELEREAQAKMDVLARELHEDFALSVTRLLKPGFVVDEILFLAQRVKADMVVMGFRGASLKPDQLLGHVTAEILQKAACPVLCVPSTASYENLCCIACLQDSEEALPSLPGFAWLQDLGVKQVGLPLGPAKNHRQVAVPAAYEPAPIEALLSLASHLNGGSLKQAGEVEMGGKNEKVPVFQPQWLVLPHSSFLTCQSSWLAAPSESYQALPFLILPDRL